MDRGYGWLKWWDRRVPLTSEFILRVIGIDLIKIIYVKVLSYFNSSIKVSPGVCA